MSKKPPVLLSYAFRPFFLLAGLCAILVMGAWLMVLHGSGLASLNPLWHAHEMLIGFAMATVAGFSLTAVATWTGRPAVSGAPLLLLILCWLLGRLAMTLTALLPPLMVAALDMTFPVLLCVLLGREIVAAGNRRNYVLIVVIAVIAVLNALFHFGASQVLPNTERLALNLLIHMVLLLVSIIAGRIIPSFTANWLRKQGCTRLPTIQLSIDLPVLVLTLLVGLAASFKPMHPLTGVLALGAAFAHGFRLSRWHGFATISNPLLFVLHAAYIWLPIGYALMACAVFGWVFPLTAAIHALTMGAIGSMVLAVITRVALGHTGRPLHAARATVAAYWILMLAVVARVLAPLAGNAYLMLIDWAVAGWILAFAIFLWVYWPILTRPASE